MRAAQEGRRGHGEIDDQPGDVDQRGFPHRHHTRPGGATQVFAFADCSGYLESIDEIPEPHEFKARLQLSRPEGDIDHELEFVEHHAHAAGAERDRNMRAAFIHVLADAVVAVLGEALKRVEAALKPGQLTLKSVGATMKSAEVALKLVRSTLKPSNVVFSPTSTALKSAGMMMKSAEIKLKSLGTILKPVSVMFCPTSAHLAATRQTHQISSGSLLASLGS